MLGTFKLGRSREQLQEKPEQRWTATAVVETENPFVAHCSIFSIAWECNYTMSAERQIGCGSEVQIRNADLPNSQVAPGTENAIDRWQRSD